MYKLDKFLELFVKKATKELFDYSKNILSNIQKDQFEKIRRMSTESQYFITNNSGLFNGHSYSFVHKIRPPEEDDLFSPVYNSLNSVLGCKSKINKTNSGFTLVTFGTDDVVIYPKDGPIDYDTHAFGTNITAEGVTVVTTDHHSLNGALNHFCVKCGEEYYMLRIGIGCYPIPILGAVVDYMNCKYGAKLWQLTDWICDYKRKGKEEFVNFYGKNAALEVESILFAQSYEWINTKNNSFLGQGEFEFLGNPYGSSGDYFMSVINLGVCTRILQEKWIEYYKDKQN